MRKVSTPPQSTTPKERVVHLSGRPRVLSPTESSELCGGSGRSPIEYILTRVEKPLTLLPAEMAEEARQEAVRIIKDSSRPRDNWTGAERKAPRALQTTTEHTIFPADKGDSTVVFNPVDYNQKLVPSSRILLMKGLPRIHRDGRTQSHTFS